MKSSLKPTRNRHLRNRPLIRQQRCLNSRNFHLLRLPCLQVLSSACLSSHVREEPLAGAQFTIFPSGLVFFSRSTPSYILFPLRRSTHHHSPSRRSIPPLHPPHLLPHRLPHPPILSQLLFNHCTFMSKQPVAYISTPRSAQWSPVSQHQPL